MSKSTETKKLNQKTVSKPKSKNKSSEEEKFAGAVKTDVPHPEEKNTQREQAIAELTTRLEKCIGEAKEYLNYNGQQKIKEFRNFLSTLNLDVDTGIQSIIMRLRKQADEIMEGLHPIDFIVEQLNKKHAVVLDKGVQYIFFDDDGDFSFADRKDLINYYENQPIDIGSEKLATKAHVWLKHPYRRSIGKIVFIPTEDETKIKELEEKGYYNLWRGFPIKPQPGSGKGKEGRLLIWDHLEYVICNGNKELYDFVRRWAASVFQHPEKVHTALVIRGGQGAGKDTFAIILGKLWGKHFQPLNDDYRAGCKI